MLEKIDAVSEQFGRPETLLADNGYFSEANVMQCAAAKIEPLIATGRQPHHPAWRERFAAPLPAPENPTPVEAMAWRLRTPQGKQLYGLRKQTPEPVFGIIKSVIGFRQFLLRGTRSRSRRVEPRHHGLEHQENVCAQPGLSALPALRSNRGGGVQKSPHRRHVQSQQMFFGEIYDSIRGRIDAGKKSTQVRQAARSSASLSSSRT